MHVYFILKMKYFILKMEYFIKLLSIHMYCKIKGYLSLYEKKWVTKEWKELFVILCEVGLILFENPGD